MTRSHTSVDFPAVTELPVNDDLPDPFETFDGEPVQTATAWYDRRRPELRRLFRHYVYGYAPDPPNLEADSIRVNGVLDGQATLTEATLRFTDLPADAPTIDVALFTPVNAVSVPTFVGLNARGNHTTVSDDRVSVTVSGRPFAGIERGVQENFWCVSNMIARGYGFATFHQADIDPDHDDFTNGIHPHYDRTDLRGPVGTEWGTIAAWAWGLQRVVDYLQTDSLVNDDEIAVIGHSRRGKAALLAGATDERISMVVPHQSGTGGCAPSRKNTQETVAAINEAFPHWFNDVFPAFAGRADRLPVDQHLLMALVAPRPLLETEGLRDYWTNPSRALDALRAAAPVYELLGADGMADSGLLFEDTEITPDVAGDLLQYRRDTGHTLNRGYWDAILDFADCHFHP